MEWGLGPWGGENASHSNHALKPLVNMNQKHYTNIANIMHGFDILTFGGEGGGAQEGKNDSLDEWKGQFIT